MGFIAATSMNLAGNVWVVRERDMVIFPSSKGCLNTSRAVFFKVGEFIQKQDAVMDQRDLSGDRIFSASGYSHIRNGMVGGPEGPN